MTAATAWRPLRVLVVDDSAMVRKLVRSRLQTAGRLEVVGLAHSSEEAIRQMVLTAPEVLLVDEHLPGMNGTEFVRKVMARCPIPSVMFSSRADAEMRERAAQAGVYKVLAKPSGLNGAEDFWSALGEALLEASGSRINRLPMPSAAPLVIGIAVSTGGPPVVQRVLSELPPDLPPIVIVQHMRAGFTDNFVNQLRADAAMPVSLGHDGAPLLPGHAYVAPDGQQCMVVGNRGRLYLKLGGAGLVSGHTPSGDALLSSIAFTVGGRCVGVVLTGMGTDGASGLLTMRRAGGRTIAQDQGTSTVYGMPKAAAEKGAAGKVVALESLARSIAQAAT